MKKSELTAEKAAQLGQCLVIGGGGFLGRHLVCMLREFDVPVRVLGRHQYPELNAMGVDCMVGDITEDGVAIRACKGIQTVFHTASISDMWGKRATIYRINVKGTAQVIRACLENKCPRLIYTSSPSVVIGCENIINGNEQLPYPKTYLADYPATKKAAEQMVLEANCWETVPNTPEEDRPEIGAGNVHHLYTCALRPHLMWGHDDPHILPNLYHVAVKKHLRQIGDGKNEVTITHVENAAWAHVLAALELCGEKRCAGQPYFIGDTPPVLLWPWIRDALARMGKAKIWKKPVSLKSALIAASFFEKIFGLFCITGKPYLTRFIVNQLANSHSFDITAAKRDFGYEMVVSPEEGLKDLLNMEIGKS